MNTASANTESQKQVSMLQMARLRVQIAESRLVEAKEQARVARRKRKETKVIARRAKKEAKQAKDELAEAQSFLADTEAKLATPTASVAKAHRGRPVSSAVSAGPNVVPPTAPMPDSEQQASTASIPVAAIVAKPLEAPPRSIFGNWR